MRALFGIFPRVSLYHWYKWPNLRGKWKCLLFGRNIHGKENFKKKSDKLICFWREKNWNNKIASLPSKSKSYVIHHKVDWGNLPISKIRCNVKHVIVPLCHIIKECSKSLQNSKLPMSFLWINKWTIKIHLGTYT